MVKSPLIQIYLMSYIKTYFGFEKTKGIGLCWLLTSLTSQPITTALLQTITGYSWNSKKINMKVPKILQLNIRFLCWRLLTSESYLPVYFASYAAKIAYKRDIKDIHTRQGYWKTISNYLMILRRNSSTLPL